MPTRTLSLRLCQRGRPPLCMIIHRHAFSFSKVAGGPMRAVQVQAHGGPEVLELVERPDPEPGPGDVVVDVAAAGVNFIDTYQRKGMYQVPLPLVLGNEGAGRVRSVGSAVAGVAVG